MDFSKDKVEHVEKHPNGEHDGLPIAFALWEADRGYLACIKKSIKITRSNQRGRSHTSLLSFNVAIPVRSTRITAMAPYRYHEAVCADMQLLLSPQSRFLVSCCACMSVIFSFPTKPPPPGFRKPAVFSPRASSPLPSPRFQIDENRVHVRIAHHEPTGPVRGCCDRHCSPELLDAGFMQC